MARKKWNEPAVVIKVDPIFDKTFKEFRKMNKISSDREASIKFAKLCNFKLKGQKMIGEDIVF